MAPTGPRQYKLMRIPGHAILAAALVAVSSGSASAQDVSDLERFQLFAECRPMSLVFGNRRVDEAKIGLTRERLQTLAEGRLRGARLYDAEVPNFLAINVSASIRGAFAVEVSYYKGLYDFATDQFGMAQTWTRGSFGEHSRDPGIILQGLSDLLDRFILEYLRVNEAACER